MDNQTKSTLAKDFDENGYTIIRNGLSTDVLKQLNADIENWISTSGDYDKPFGKMMDGRARFDIEPTTHSKENPALRRVGAPIEISENFLDLVCNNMALDLVADIFSCPIKLYASKLNLKLPNSGTIVKFHQDFPFDPHSNDDMITVLFFLDDVTEDNGPLKVISGSHKGPIYSLTHDGIFTGAVEPELEKSFHEKSVRCNGKAGDICLMHARTLHGSQPNFTDKSRNLLIVTYVADDAVALVPNPIPHKYDGRLVHGERTGRIRSTPFNIETPEYPKEASFFSQQSKMN